MLSSAMNPFLDAELAYRQERLAAGLPHVRFQGRRRSLWPVFARTSRTLAHRPAPSH